jgi:MYXO-CTERM domain-containing protein
MKSLRPVLAAAGLLVTGLALTSPVLACPGSKSAPKPLMAATPPADHPECGYARRASSGSCSFGSQLLAASVPAGLMAFGLGWLTGGRRRKQDHQA